MKRRCRVATVRPQRPADVPRREHARVGCFSRETCERWRTAPPPESNTSRPSPFHSSASAGGCAPSSPGSRPLITSCLPRPVAYRRIRGASSARLVRSDERAFSVAGVSEARGRRERCASPSTSALPRDGTCDLVQIERVLVYLFERAVTATKPVPARRVAVGELDAETKIHPAAH